MPDFPATFSERIKPPLISILLIDASIVNIFSKKLKKYLKNVNKFSKHLLTRGIESSIIATVEF